MAEQNPELKDLAYDLLIAEIGLVTGSSTQEKVDNLRKEIQDMGVSLKDARRTAAEQAASMYLRGTR